MVDPLALAPGAGVEDRPELVPREEARQGAQRIEPGEDGMRDTVYTLGKLGAPLITGAIAHFECRVALRYDGGDPVIFVGAVEGGEIDDEAEPLLYFQGKYRGLSPP